MVGVKFGRLYVVLVVECGDFLGMLIIKYFSECFVKFIVKIRVK